MSDVIDTNIVELKFDSNEFVNGVNHSIMAVDALKDSLKFDSNAFDALTKSANNVDFSTVAANIESLSNRFSTFGIVGMTAIQRITNELMTLGGKFVGLLAKPWNQILTGGWNRASNIGQAKFQLEGLFGKSEEGVAKLNMTMMATSEQVAKLAEESQGFSEDMIVAMNAADYAVADTAYGLDSAAKAASVLATSGVDVVHFSEDLKDANGLMRTEMQVALRGISGVAAMANREYDDVARVFERVSGAGRVMGDDLNSLASYGLNAAATLRDYMNELGETTNATEQDIRDMVSKGQIDFMTFAKAMDSAYGDHAKDANNTFSGAFGNMKFALSKIGADFITPIRSKMVPLFNDVRIAINNVRKALNYKIKIPGLEEEISIVEAFSNVITNLTAKAHDFFVVWNGGQTVLEKGMSGFVQYTGAAFQDVKGIYDAVADGSKKDVDAISELISIASKSGHNMQDVFKTLGETLGETEDDIYSMCYNGQISFEQFSNAVSATFGDLVQETRINQLSQIFSNLIQIVINLAKVVTTTVGPIIWAFFKMFTGGGVHSVIEATQAFANFTAQLHFSRETQYKLYQIATKVFTTLKSGVKIIAKIISTIIKVAMELAPLIDDVLDFIDIIATIVEYIVDIAVQSNLLSSAVMILGKAFQAAGYIIINVLQIIFALIGPAIKGIGEVFAFLARSIGNIDLSFLEVLIDRFKELFLTIANGGVVTVIQSAVGIFFNAIIKLFSGLTMSFEWLNAFLKNASIVIANIFDRVITTVKKFKDMVVNLFNGIVDTLQNNPEKIVAMVGQFLGFSVLLRFAQTLSGISKIFNGVGNLINSNAISNFLNAIKTLARAILEFAVAMVLVSSIPRENLKTTLILFRYLCEAIISFMIAFYAYQLILNNMNNKIIADPYVKFMNKLSASLNNFMVRAGRATIIVSVAILLLSLAASLGLFIKAIQKIASLDTSVFEVGIVRISEILAILAVFLGAIAIATRQSIWGNFNETTINTIGGNNGMMGSALVLLALIVVLKAFEDIIKDYNEIGLNQAQWEQSLGRITSVMIILVTSISIMGLTVKRAGFGLMGSIVAMMGFLIVLNAFVEIIRNYSSLAAEMKHKRQDINTALTIIYEVVGILTIGIAAIGFMLGASGGTSFSAAFGKGIQFQNNSAKFFSVMLTIVSIALVLQSVALILGVMNLFGIEKNIAALGEIIGAIAVVMGTLVASLALIKGVKTGNIFGVAFVLLELAAILPLLTTFDADRVLAGAESLSVIMVTFGLMVKFLAESELTFLKGVGTAGLLFVVIHILALAFFELQAINPVSMLASAMAMAFVLTTLGVALAFTRFGSFRPDVIMQIAALLGTLSVAFYALTFIPDFDPNKMLAITECLAVLGLAMATITLITSRTTIVNGIGLMEAFVGVAIALGILAEFLVDASNKVTGNVENIKYLALFINYLAPIIAAISVLSVLVGKMGTWKGMGMMAAVVAITAGLVAAFHAIASVGNVDNTIKLINNIAVGLLELSSFMLVLSVFAGALGLFMLHPVAQMVLGGGMIALVGILTMVGVFINTLAHIAQFGDVGNTVYLLDNLGGTLDAMVPFLLKMGAMCAAFGIVSPFLVSGAVGFASILTVLSGFVAMIAIISQIGSPADTITVLNGLISAMEAFNEFMGHFMLVLTLLGTVAPLAILGASVLNIIFKILVSFTGSIATIGTIGNVGNTISVMTTLVDSMRELVNVFSIVMVLGVLGPAVLTGMILITSSVGMMLGLSLMIGQIGSIREAIINGISTIMYTAETMHDATVAMSGIDIPAIAQFILALGLVALAPIHGVAKFAQIASMMALMGASSIYISRGSDVAVEMISDLRTAAYMIKDIIKVDTKNLESMSENILKSAYNISAVYNSIGGWIGYSLAAGALSNGSLGSVIAAGVMLALAMEMAVRNTADVHSESPLYNEIGSWFPKSMGNGALDNVGSLIGSGTDMMSQFGSSMLNQAGAWGTAAGGSYVESMSQTMFEFLQYAGQGWKDLLNYTGLVDYMGVVGEQLKEDNIVALASGNDIHNTITTDVKFRGNFRSYEEYLEWEKAHPNGDDADISLGFELPDFADLESWLEGLKESFNLGAIGESFSDLTSGMDSIGNTAGVASSQTDELTKKIEDLMDEYEHLWENAKKNANKDLFKGVDDQGDEFLDKINDIMSEYENIFSKAVERTNGQDLFAEVNEEDESFAPETLMRNLEDQVNQVNELNTIIASLSGRITDNNLRAAIANMDVDDLPQLRAMYRMTSTQLGEYEKMYQQKVLANQNKIQNELSGELSQLTGEYTNVASYIATDASTNELVNNLQAQIDQLNEYNATVASLMYRITDMNLREAIAEMGVEALPELKKLNAMNDEMLNQYQAMYNEKIAAEAVSLKQELSAQLSAAMGQPLDIEQFYVAYKNGIVQLANTIETDGATSEAGKAAGSALAKSTEEGMKESFDTETAKQTGKDYTIALAEGMRDKDAIDQLETTVNGLISMIIEPLQDAHEQFKQCGLYDVAKAFFEGIDTARLSVEYTEVIQNVGYKFINVIENMNYLFKNLGMNIVIGLRDGIDEHAAIVAASATKVAVRALSAAKAAVGSNSPAKEFIKLGRYMDEGLAIGLRDYSNVADEAAGDMALGTLSPMQEAINQLSGMLDGSIDINPTITPTLDLSQVNARSAALANMFNGKQIAVQARADERQAEMMEQFSAVLAKQPTVTNNTFNQTNNSPKALSRTEIYRQTKTAFSQFASAIS